MLVFAGSSLYRGLDVPFRFRETVMKVNETTLYITFLLSLIPRFLSFFNVPKSPAAEGP